MANTRQDAVRRAINEVGQHEEGTSNRQKYGVWYGFNGVAWCSIFASWVLALGGNKTGYRFALCAAARNWAKANGRWQAVSLSKPGDVLNKDYGGGKGHAGIFIKMLPGNIVQSVEGNTGADDRDGGKVMLRNRSAGWWTGSIRIDFDDVATPAPPPPPVAVPVNRPTLRQGDKGPHVVHLQHRLNQLGARPQLSGDGDFGPKTKRAVLAFQRSRNLSADGVVGPITWGALR